MQLVSLFGYWRGDPGWGRRRFVITLLRCGFKAPVRAGFFGRSSLRFFMYFLYRMVFAILVRLFNSANEIELSIYLNFVTSVKLHNRYIKYVYSENGAAEKVSLLTK